MKFQDRFIKKIGAAILSTSIIAISLIMAPIKVNADQAWPEGPEIASPCAVVMEVNTGTVLYEKNPHEKHYPASITKILTTYLAIKNCDMDEKVVFSADAVFKNEGDTSNISRDLYEEMTMEQTLYAVMLESANECAYAAAEHTGQKLGGDYSTFVDLMNKTAADLGCTDTHFNNANGLPDENHYTSAYDMGLIGCAAYKNEEFKKITSTKTYTIPPTNKHSTETPLNNHHALLHKYRQATQYVNPYCTGGKTGFTKVANSTLVTFAEKDGLTLCIVIMNTDSPNHWIDTNKLIDYCFSNFKALNIAENEADVAKSEEENLGVLNSNKMYAEMSSAYITMPITAEFSDAKKEAMDKTDEGALATVEYTYADHIVGKVNLVKSDAKVDLSYFNNSTKNEKSDIIKIKPFYIFAVLFIIAFIIAAVIVGRKISDNFYVLRHNISVKKEQKERFRIQKKKRRRRKKYELSFKEKTKNDRKLWKK